MDSSLHYIDDYFTGALSDDEKRVFEQRCASDNDFAKEVAEYISIRDELNARLQQQKKEEFEGLYQELSTPSRPARIITLRRIGYLAAASVLLLIGWFTFFHQANPQTIADKYIAANLDTLGLNMGVSDSLQMGIAAYNSKSYTAAERLFKPLATQQENAAEAIKDLGLTHLAMKQYNEALKNFDELSAMPLYTNPGQFYKALTLMVRSERSDAQQARKILQQIINKNLYGNQQARNWVKQIKN